MPVIKNATSYYDLYNFPMFLKQIFLWKSKDIDEICRNSHFRALKIQNFLRPPTMVVNIFSYHTSSPSPPPAPTFGMATPCLIWGLNMGFLESFTNFTGKYLCCSHFFSKVAALQLYYKRLQHRYFLLKFAKFLRTPFFTEHLLWLLL